MSSEQDILNALYLFLKKISIPTLYILLGIMANYVDHYRKGTLSWKQIIVSGTFGVIAGYTCFELCLALGFLRHAGYVVPVITMVGEKIFPYLLENATTLLARFIDFLESKTKKKD